MDDVHALLQGIYHKYEEHLELMNEEQAINFLLIYLSRELIAERQKYYNEVMKQKRLELCNEDN